MTKRAKGELYLRGLVLDGKRKSMQPMAGWLGGGHQQLQRFVTTSTDAVLVIVPDIDRVVALSDAWTSGLSSDGRR